MEEQQQNTDTNAARDADTNAPVQTEGKEQAGSPNDVDQQAVSGQFTAAETTDSQQTTGEQVYNQNTAAQNQAQPTDQPKQPGQAYQLPPGYGVDPVTGQVVFVGDPVIGQPMQPGYVQPQVVYMQPPQPTPEQVTAQQAATQQRYGRVVGTVEKFIEGEATVADVVKTLYTSTAQDDQLWKGIIVGAAAAFLLTSEPVRKTMGETFGGVFPGLKKKQPAAPAADTKVKASTKPETKKE